MQALLGQKVQQSQRFLENGTRVPVTVIAVTPNPVTAVKTQEKHGYIAVQIGFGTAKKPSKSLQGIAKQAKLQSVPTILREIKMIDALPQLGDQILATDVFKPGDIIQVTGMSKGKGWAGGVKRYHFRGGPRTHGQSDRERAPGSIGQTTTPGRVYKGKRMAGRMGHEQVTVKNLKVIDVTDKELLIAGLVPGPVNNIVLIQKTGENKKFVPLFKIAEPEPETPAVETTPAEVVQPVTEEVSSSIEAPVSQEAVAEVIAEDAATTSVQEATEESSSETKIEDATESSDAAADKKAADAESSGESKEEENGK